MKERKDNEKEAVGAEERGGKGREEALEGRGVAEWEQRKAGKDNRKREGKERKDYEREAVGGEERKGKEDQRNKEPKQSRRRRREVNGRK